jgi:hypothetical protein
MNSFAQTVENASEAGESELTGVSESARVDAGAIREPMIDGEQRQRFGLFSYKSIWLPPLGAEMFLLLSACALSNFFLMVMTQKPFDTSLILFVISVGAFAGTSAWVRFNELFMPRPIILLCLTPLVCTSVALMVLALAFSNWMGEGLSLPKRGIVILPFVFFIMRYYFVLQGARYAPRLRSMEHRRSSRTDGLGSMRKNWDFWMN